MTDNQNQYTTSTPKPLSVLLAVHDQGAELQRNLPLLLDQQYEPGYEVIVVDESSSDDTEDILKQLKTRYPHLYSTYIPASSHYVSRRKLALTVGMKAANNEWVIITEASCHPEDESWLTAMASGMTDEHDVVCSYTAYADGTKSRYAFLRLTNWRRQLWRPYRYDGACLAIRKSVFMQRNGFLHNLQYLRSEYDFLVNETPRDRINLLNTPESRLIQEEPTPKSWHNAQLFYMQSRSQLCRTFLQRLLFATKQLLLHLGYALSIAAIVAGALLRHPVYIAIGAVLLLGLLVTRTLLARRKVAQSGEHIPLWKLPLLDLGIAWHYVYYKLRYLMADKYDFLRK